MFDTLTFWACLAATAAVFCLSPPAWVRARTVVLSGSSLFVLALVVDVGLWFGFFLLISIAWVMIAARISAANRARRLTPYLLAPVAIAWIVSKEAPVIGFGWFAFVGYSYFFIKAWTLLKDIETGRVESADPLVVAAYFLNFPTFVSGPMHLFAEFDRSVRAPAFVGPKGLVDVSFRILLGLAKLKVLVPLLMPLSLNALVESGELSMGKLAVASIVYSAVIWANFSGYTDLAVAVSRLMGMYAPENFNNPYAAPNIREFWQRWHMSFTRVLTSYVFIPLSRRLQVAMGGSPRALMVASTLVTFLFCGFWHGAAPNFILWGIYHALGLVAFDLYRPGAVRRRLARRGSPNAMWAGRIEYFGGMLLTFLFVSAGWILFVLPASRLLGN